MDFVILFYFIFGLGGRGERFFLHFWLVLGIFLFFLFVFSFYFVLGEGERVFFLICFSMFFVFSDHFWPAPLLAETAS